MAYKPYRGYTWNISTYYPAALAKRPEKELRKEYSRLRSVAQKSLKRLWQSEFAYGETARQHRKGFPTLKQITSQRQLVMATTSVAQFLAAKSHSVLGLREIRQEQINTWKNEYGYDFVNYENFEAWYNFIETMADEKGFVYESRDDRRYVNKADAVSRKEEIQSRFNEFMEKYGYE